ncbi:MAG: hypothetical protein IK102_09465, partial [Treponema sp.]|nr:hypothetical protein [Treponema sp.]
PMSESRAPAVVPESVLFNSFANSFIIIRQLSLILHKKSIICRKLNKICIFMQKDKICRGFGKQVGLLL